MKKNLHIKCRVIVLLVYTSAVFLLIQGCKKSDQPPEPAQAGKAASVATTPQVKPVQKQVSSVVRLAPAPVNQFDFSTKKDPFKPYIIVKSSPVTPKERKRLDGKLALPIHRYDVSQFKLIGVVTGGKENNAMVVDPTGKAYVLKVGMTIGNNDGRVVSVTNSGVEILEQFRDDNGKVRKEHIKLALPRK